MVELGTGNIMAKLQVCLLTDSQTEGHRQFIDRNCLSNQRVCGDVLIKCIKQTQLNHKKWINILAGLVSFRVTQA